MHYSTSSKSCTQTLLLHGGLPSESDHLGAKAIHLAGYFSCSGSIEELLKIDSSYINSKDQDENTLLHYLANNTNLILKSTIYCVEFLMTQNRDLLDAKNHKGESPIHVAASCGNIIFLKSILENITKLELSYYFNLRDSKGRTPIHSSAIFGHSNVFLFFIQQCGINYKIYDNNHHTPLHLAVLNNQKEFLQEILSSSENNDTNNNNNNINNNNNTINTLNNINTLHEDLEINLLDSDGRSPFFYAAWSGFDSILDVLLLYDVDLENFVDSFGNNAIHHSVDGDHVVSIRLIMDEEPDEKKILNHQNQYGIAPIHIAAAKNHSSCLKELLNYDTCNVNIIDKQGRSPLHYACYYGNIKCVNLLIDHNVDINLHDKNGNSALFYASFHGHLPCISSLIKNNAKILDINSDGRTALHGASWCGSLRACEILLESNSSLLDKPCNNGRTPLHRACVKNHLKIIEFLLDKNAEINYPDSNGATPLMLACYHQKIDVVKFLMEHNACSDIKDELDRSVASYAKRGAKTHKDSSHLQQILSLVSKSTT